MIRILYYHTISEKVDVLPYLWSKLKQDDVPPWLYGDGHNMTLTDFVLYFSNLERHLFLPFYLEENETEIPDLSRCLGLVWVDQCVSGLRANAHLYFFREFQRERKRFKLRDICRQIMEIFAKPPFNLRVLHFFMDERAISLKNFITKLGAVYVTNLPFYFSNTGASVGYLPLNKGSIDHG